MDAHEQGGKLILHIYVGKARIFPLHINMLEKHPFFLKHLFQEVKNHFIVLLH